MDVASLAELLALPTLAADLALVEHRMVAVLSDDRYTPQLVEPGLRVVTGGGKRLRPVLALAAAQLGSGGTADAITSASVAVELVQVGSLVHDDVMDHAESRRGVATVNVQEGPNWAILVGDHLLAVAGMEAARVSADVAAALARTIADLADGQAREVVDQFNADRTVESYLTSIGGKTAALMRCACEVGALASGLTGTALDAIRSYGDHDVVATSEALGKPAGNDVPEGVFTLPVLLAKGGLETSVVPAGTVDALLATPRDPAAVAEILRIVRSCGAVPAALEMAADFNRKAADALREFGDHPTALGLAQLPGEYTSWSLDRVGYVA